MAPETNCQGIVQFSSDACPHVVILGAGASRAAFPYGDDSGKKIPLMNDLVDVVGLRSLIDREDLVYKSDEDFEKFYSKLLSNRKYSSLKNAIESEVREYFSSLRLTDKSTIYDLLLLSLRKKDAVFTFNWDPFLFDSYVRHQHIRSCLPEIFFLHGNVRVGMCQEHIEEWGSKEGCCKICSNPFHEVPLLYPIENKNYSEHPFIRESWEAAKYFLANAFVVTIFGYSGPSSDVDAVELLKSAWFTKSNRQLEHIEIIDKAKEAELYERWKIFTPTNHLNLKRCFNESWIAMYPRRSVEALMYSVYHGMPSEISPITDTEDLKNVRKQILEVIRWEQEIDSS